MHAFQVDFVAKRAKKWADDLAKKKIAIKKGQEKVLDAASVRVSVSWRGKVDLDTGCVIYAGSTVRSKCWHKDKKVEDNKIVHLGDVTAGGDADDGAPEEMRIKLSALDAEVTTVAVYLCCYTEGATFKDADDAAITIASETFDVPAETFDAQSTVTETNNIVNFSIADMDSTKSAVLLGAFNRVKGGKWAFEAVNIMSDGTGPVSEALATTLLTYAQKRATKAAGGNAKQTDGNAKDSFGF